MPQDLIQTNFTSGELSPLLAALVDQSKYYNGLEICENFLIQPQGGIYRRGGSQYIGNTKNNAKVRLIPFIFSSSQAYILEFGAYYIRFFANGGQVMSGGNPYEVVTPYTAAQVWELNFVQSNDVLYLARRGSPLKKLVRLAHDNWVFNAVTFIHPPTTINQLYPASTLTPAAISGTGILFTISVVSQAAKMAHGSDTLTGIGDTSGFTVNGFVTVSKGFTGDQKVLGKAAATLQLNNSAVATTTGDTTNTSDIITNVANASLFAAGDKLTVSAGIPGTLTVVSVGATTIRVSAAATSSEVGVTITGTEIAVIVKTLGFLHGDVGRDLQYPSKGARATITSWLSTTQVYATIYDPFPDTNPIPANSWYIKGYSSVEISAPSWAGAVGTAGIDANWTAGTSLTLTGASSCFRESDVGKYLPIWGGVLKVVTFTSPTVIVTSIIKDLAVRPSSTSSTDKYKTAYWSTEEDAWTDAKGWPGAVCFFESRLIAAGTDSFPQTGWASAVSNFEDFALGSNDADAWSFTLAGDQLNNILWVIPMSALMLGTTDQEWLLRGGQNPISPASPPVAKAETGYGCNLVRPLNLVSHALFLQRNGYKLRDMRYQFETDSFISNDLMLLSDHLTGKQKTITQLAKSAAPQQIIWAVRSDGVLLSLTYQREQEVMAWARHVTDGLIESVAAIPGTDEDEVWLTVVRTIGGATKRFIERLKWFSQNDLLADAFYVDAGLTYDGAAATVISGLGHLEGETVAVLTDGAVHPNKTVSGGAITLEWAASTVQAGLPMTSKIKTMRPEIPGGKITTLQAVRRRVVQAMLRLDRSRGGQIGPNSTAMDYLDYRKPADRMDQISLYSGDILVNPRSSSDWYGQLEIICDQPLPFNLTMLVTRLEGGAM